MMKKLILLFALLPMNSFAANYTLNMTAPTEYTDNTPLAPSDIDHYTVFYSFVSGGPYTSLGNTIYLTNTYNVAGLAVYFVATVTTIDGKESDYSNEVYKIAPKPKPPVLR